MFTITSSHSEREARRVQNAVPAATQQAHSPHGPCSTFVHDSRDSSKAAISGLSWIQEFFRRSLAQEASEGAGSIPVPSH